MLKLDNVTLVMVDTLDDFKDKSNIRIAVMSKILPKILEQVQFGDIISVNPFNKNKHLINPNIEQLVWNRNKPEIDSINWYCEFIVSKIPYMVKTDYYLIMQWDGFIVHPNNWSDDFLKYDYIGGGHTLLNGGFSLRKTESMRNIIENGNPQILSNDGVSSEDHLYSCYFKFPMEFDKKEYNLPFYIEWPGENIINSFCCQMIYNDKSKDVIDYNYGWILNSFGWHRSGNLTITSQVNQYVKLNVFSPEELKLIRNYSLLKETYGMEYDMKKFSMDYNESFFNY